MARSYARVLCAIWDDPEFVALDAATQRAYLLVLSHKSVTSAGILPLQPRKWGRLAADTTTDDLEDAVARLAAARFVLIDEATEEVLIRTFIRHDGGTANRNMVKGIAYSIDRIESDELRAVAAAELERCTQPRSERRPEEGSEPRPVDNSAPAANPGQTTSMNAVTNPVPDAVPNAVGNPVPNLPSSQQPAASSQAPRTTNHEPAAAAAPIDVTKITSHVEQLNSAAAAAIDIYIQHRLTSDPTIRNPTGFARDVRAKETFAHLDELNALTADDDPVAAAARIFGISHSHAIKADYHRRNGATA